MGLETKPLELLHELLLGAGKVLSKDELLDRIWPGVIVVEASLPTAVRKLRLALGDDQRDRAVIETVAGIGYRLAVPVEVECPSPPSGAPTFAEAGPSAGQRSVTGAAGTIQKRRFSTRLVWAAGGLAALAFAIALLVGPSRQIAATAAPQRVSQTDAANALRRLDVQAIEAMLAAGWSPNTPFDGEGTTAITYVLEMCEWDPAHDRRRMLLMVRTLYSGGGHIHRPNFWGDTAYSIAKAPRYCGPDHPVTEMLRRLCYSGAGAPGDRCLATYELARRSRPSGGQ
ncbi:winged helix-turn-helix domain-containing protein [Allosphingosinicella sp.]|uniref:winged helix-turn-helix domain-containing protein n=1 Tax=Allosphingosinicella sp. TaxID=2823234 RepID=UPI002EFA3EE5